MGCGASNAVRAEIEAGLTLHVPAKQKDEMTPFELAESNEIDRELQAEYDERRRAYEEQQRKWKEDLDRNAAEQQAKRAEEDARLKAILEEQASAAQIDAQRSEEREMSKLSILNEVSRLNLEGRYHTALQRMEEYVHAVGSSHLQFVGVDHWVQMATSLQWKARYAWLSGREEDEYFTAHENPVDDVASSIALERAAASRKIVNKEGMALTPTQRALELYSELAILLKRLSQAYSESVQANVAMNRKNSSSAAANTAAIAGHGSPRLSTAHLEGYIPSTPSRGSRLMPRTPATAARTTTAAVAANVEVIHEDNSGNTEEQVSPTPFVVNIEASPLQPPRTPLHPSQEQLQQQQRGAGPNNNNNDAFANLFTPRFAPGSAAGGVASPRTPRENLTHVAALTTQFPYVHHHSLTATKIQKWKAQVEAERQLLTRYLTLEATSFHAKGAAAAGAGRKRGQKNLDSSLETHWIRIKVLVLRELQLNYAIVSPNGEKVQIRHAHSFAAAAAASSTSPFAESAAKFEEEEAKSPEPVPQTPGMTSRSTPGKVPATPSSSPHSYNFPKDLLPRNHHRFLLERSKIHTLFQYKLLEAIVGSGGRVKFDVQFQEAHEAAPTSFDKPGEEAKVASPSSSSPAAPLVVTKLHHTHAHMKGLWHANYTSGPVLSEIQPKGRIYDLIYHNLFHRHSPVPASNPQSAAAAAAAAAAGSEEEADSFDLMVLLWNDHNFYPFEVDEEGSSTSAAPSTANTAGGSILLEDRTEPFVSGHHQLQWILPFQLRAASTPSGLLPTSQTSSLPRSLFCVGIHELNREHGRMVALKQVWGVVKEWWGADKNHRFESALLSKFSSAVSAAASSTPNNNHHELNIMTALADSYQSVISAQNLNYRLRYPLKLLSVQSNDAPAQTTTTELFCPTYYHTNKKQFLSVSKDDLRKSQELAHAAMGLWQEIRLLELQQGFTSAPVFTSGITGDDASSTIADASFVTNDEGQVIPLATMKHKANLLRTQKQNELWSYITQSAELNPLNPTILFLQLHHAIYAQVDPHAALRIIDQAEQAQFFPFHASLEYRVLKAMSHLLEYALESNRVQASVATRVSGLEHGFEVLSHSVKMGLASLESSQTMLEATKHGAVGAAQIVTACLREKRFLLAPVRMMLHHSWRVLLANIKLKRNLPDGWTKASLLTAISQFDALKKDCRRRLLEQVFEQQPFTTGTTPLWFARYAYANSLLKEGDVNKALAVIDAPFSDLKLTPPFPMLLFRARLLLHIAAKRKEGMKALEALKPRCKHSFILSKTLSHFLYTTLHGHRRHLLQGEEAMNNDAIQAMYATARALSPYGSLSVAEKEAMKAQEETTASSNTAVPSPVVVRRVECAHTLFREGWFLLLICHAREKCFANWKKVIQVLSSTPLHPLRLRTSRLLFKYFAWQSRISLKDELVYTALNKKASQDSLAQQIASGKRPVIRVACVRTNLDAEHLVFRRLFDQLTAASGGDGNVAFTFQTLSPTDLATEGVLTREKYDVLLFATHEHGGASAVSGSGSSINHSTFSALFSSHKRAALLVKSFVEQGGGYLAVGGVGIDFAIQGAFTGLVPLNRLDSETLSTASHLLAHQRPHARVPVDILPAAVSVLKAPEGLMPLLFENEPLLTPAFHMLHVEEAATAVEDLPSDKPAETKRPPPPSFASSSLAGSDTRGGGGSPPSWFEVWARFHLGVEGTGSLKEVMPSCAAVVAGSYGRGRVMLFAVQPQHGEETAQWIARAAEWMATANDNKQAR